MNDLTGKIFGELTVVKINKRGSAGNHILWECECSCGKTTLVKSNLLLNGHTKSCGHLVSIKNIERFKKYNNFDMSGDFGIGLSSNTNSLFYFDLEDYDNIKNYCWHLDEYLTTTINHKRIKLHRLLLNAKDGEIVDHINRNVLDNRKENLRLVTSEENCRNRGITERNKIGIIGISRRNNKWRANIKGKHLATCDTLEGAIILRLKAEKETFGIEFAPQRHLFDTYGI